MEGIKKKIIYVWGVLFIVCLYVFGISNALCLISFYVNNEKSNNEWTEEMGTHFEADYITNFWGKNVFINVHGGICRLLGQQEMNGVTKLENGYLVTLMEPIEEAKIKQEIEQAAIVQEDLENSGIDYLYVMTPYTVCKYDTQLPATFPDVGNAVADKVLYEMQLQNIRCLDIREKILEAGCNHYDMMYKTDHHWNEKGGFFAYQEVINYIEKQLAIETNSIYQDMSNYEVVTYEKWHLGSNGQRTGTLYAGIDDFRMIMPKFKTRFSRNGLSGDFKETFICEDALKKTDYSSRYTYDTTFNSIGHFVNELSENDIKVVLICDSMGKAVAPYLALSINELYVLDAYSIRGVYLEEIKQYNPDMVIFLHSPGMYKYEGLFEFKSSK